MTDGAQPPSSDLLSGLDSPFHRFLGIEARKTGEGTAEVRLPFREELRRQEGLDMFHGGVISALADIAGDFAVATVIGGAVPTIDLRLDYLRPAQPGTLIARAKALKVGRTVAVADVEIYDQSERLVAVARGAYSSRAG
jgi:uncharacterized protein (TIGR00369 family)